MAPRQSGKLFGRIETTVIETGDVGVPPFVHQNPEQKVISLGHVPCVFRRVPADRQSSGTGITFVYKLPELVGIGVVRTDERSRLVQHTKCKGDLASAPIGPVRGAGAVSRKGELL